MSSAAISAQPAAQKHRLPAISFLKACAQAGVLMTYGPLQEVHYPVVIVAYGPHATDAALAAAPAVPIAALLGDFVRRAMHLRSGATAAG
jgi:hypothetical protein